MLMFVSERGRLRAALAVFVVLLVPVGYWLRIRSPLPAGIRDGVGGALYVIFWSAVAWWIWPKASPWRVVVVVLFTTCALEWLQLWHPAWLEALRATLPGRLVLGTTFDPTDFPPYVIGAVLAWAAFRALPQFLRIRN